MTDTENKPLNVMDWLTKGLTISILPCIAYFLEFKYEEGFCMTFGIPNYFIKPDITTVLIFASAIVGISFMLMWLIESCISLSENPQKEQAPFLHFLRLYAPVIMIILLFFSIYRNHHREWMPIGIFILIFTILDFIGAFGEDKSKPLLSRLRGPAYFFLTPGTILSKVRVRFGVGVFVLFLVIYLGSTICRSLGNAEALEQRTFLIPTSQPDMIVVRVYGDRAICCQLDKKLRKPLKKFAIIQLGKEASNTFSAEEIGPLSFR